MIRGVANSTMLVLLAMFTLGSLPARADLHFWGINEVFSNADGSVQFIEMFSLLDGQHVLATSLFWEHTFDTDANSFTYQVDLPSPQTANKFFLMATPGFGSLPGGVTPDYEIPTEFFSVSGDSLQFSSVGLSSLSFGLGELPTDGVHSLNPNFTTGINSPTNFAGQSGSIPEPASAVLLAAGLLALAAYSWRCRKQNGCRCR